MHFIELAPGVSPTGRQHDARRDQLLEPGIAIDLQGALEPLQMHDRTLGSAIGAIEVDGRRRIGFAPRSIVAGINPQPAGLGAAASHWDRRVVGEQLL
jgi:hypothetical protein